ncbi:MAG: ATP-binding protein [Bacteroidota bacterium]
MNSEILQQVLADQKQMVARKYRGVPRMVNLSMHRQSDMITVISGVRRSGKSTLTLQLADQYPAFHFITFDDERLINFTVNDFNALLIEMKRTGDAKTIVLDEVQLVPGWERFVRRLHDEGYKAIITGSNAKLLSSELATHLTGRYLKTELYPFSFAEYLLFKGIDPADKSSDNAARILTAFDDYLLNGGFPEYLKSNEPEVLKRIYDDIVYRDLIVRFGIRNVTAFKNLAQYLFTNFSGETGYLPLASLLGIQSSASIKEYFSVLTEGYLIFELTKYDFSLKRQYASIRKIYVIDNGLRNVVSFRTSADSGRLLENTVFLELKRRGFEVWYYKTGNNRETDFLINPANPMLIQVCYEMQNPKTRKREIDSLLACMKEVNSAEGLILTKNEEEAIETGNETIRVVPVWKWCLGAEKI